MSRRSIVVRLTPEQANLVWRNVDGWMDAGSCEDGLTEAEHEALSDLEDQLLRGLKRNPPVTSAPLAGEMT